MKVIVKGPHGYKVKWNNPDMAFCRGEFDDKRSGKKTRFILALTGSSDRDDVQKIVEYMRKMNEEPDGITHSPECS